MQQGCSLPTPGLFIVLMKDGAFNYTDTEGCARLGLGEGRLEPLIASPLLIARVPIILMVIKIMTLKSVHLNLHHWAGSLQFSYLNTCCWGAWLALQGLVGSSGRPEGLVLNEGAPWTEPCSGGPGGRKGHAEAPGPPYTCHVPLPRGYGLQTRFLWVRHSEYPSNLHAAFLGVHCLITNHGEPLTDAAEPAAGTDTPGDGGCLGCDHTFRDLTVFKAIP